jgi:hypothetical protein
VCDVAHILHALRRIRQGWRLELDEHGWPWAVDDEPRVAGGPESR